MSNSYLLLFGQKSILSFIVCYNLEFYVEYIYRVLIKNKNVTIFLYSVEYLNTFSVKFVTYILSIS